MMTLEQLVEKARASRRSRVCAVCGGLKKTEYAFCPRCYYKLSPEQKNLLLGSDVENYLRAFIACFQFLMTEEEPAAQKILGNRHGVAIPSPNARHLEDCIRRTAKPPTKAELLRQALKSHRLASSLGLD